MHQDATHEEWRGKGHRNLDYGEFAEATGNLIRARDLAPEDPWTLGLLAIAAGHAGDRTLMRDTARRILALDETAGAEAVRVGCWMLPTHPINPLRRAYREANYRSFLVFTDFLVEEAAGDPDRLSTLCRIFYGHQLLNAAENALLRAVAARSGDPDLLAMLNDVWLSLCDFDRHAEREMHRRRLIDKALSGSCPLEIDPYNLACIGIDFARFDQACARRSAAILAAEMAAGDCSPLSGRQGAKAPGAPLRIAFLLPYSWPSSVNMVLAPLIRAFNRGQFTVLGFSLQTSPTPAGQEDSYRRSFDRFHPLDGMGTRAAAQQIHDAGVDILLDCSGHTRTSCLPILVHRPAPVQTHFMGYGSSVVAPFCDYLITDQRYHGPALQALSAERFALLPDTSWIYPPAPASLQPASRSEFRLPESDFLYCTFNHPGKIEPIIFNAWMQILKRTRESRLVLCHWNLPDTVANLRKAAAAAGILPERLIFVPPVAHEQHMRRLPLMDLALDTLFVGGGVTSMDTLWAGLPLLSVTAGENYLHTGRGALGAVGMDDMIMPDLAAYVDRAAALREDPQTLGRIRADIKERRRHTAMFDPPRYTRDLERLLQLLWHRHAAGDPPASLSLLPASPGETGETSGP